MLSLGFGAEESAQSSGEEGVVTEVCARAKTLPVGSPVKDIPADWNVAVLSTRRCPDLNHIDRVVRHFSSEQDINPVALQTPLYSTECSPIESHHEEQQNN